MPPAHPLYLAWVAEPVAEGERRPRAPLHLTLVPPFAAPEAAVRDALAAAGREGAVHARVAGRARMGPRRDVPVLLLEPVEGLRALHARLMDLLEERAVDLTHARHVRERYRPHVAVRRPTPAGQRLSGRAPITVDHVALLRRGDGWTEVVARVPLGGSPG